MKNYRKFLVPFILIVLVAAGISRLNIESVSKHDNVSKTEINGMIAENSNPTAASVEVTADVSKDEPQESNSPGISGSDSDKKSKDSLKKNKNNTKKKKSNKKDADKTSSKKENNNTKSKKKSSMESDKKLAEADKTVSSKNNKDEKKTQNKDKKEGTSKPDKTATPDVKEQAPTEKPDKESEYIKCSISIDCDILLSNMDKLDTNARKYVPKDGKLIDKVEIKVKKGASAYDVLVAACKEKKIAYDAEYSAIYNSAYVKGIGYLYEKMAGDMSGWLYLVDGVTPNVGASAYKIKEGEHIEWTYTCSGRAGS